MILQVAKIAALFVAAGVGLYFGDLLGSRPLDALPYEYWGPIRYEHFYHGVFAGAFTTSSAYIAAKFLRIPELAALLVAFVFSIFLPVEQLTTVGDPLFSVPSLYTILHYLIPYFFGLLVVFGFIYLAGLSLQSLRPK